MAPILALAALVTVATKARSAGAEGEAPHGPVLMREAAEQAYALARRTGARLFASSRPPVSGNGSSCADCHSRPGALAGVFGRYPRYDRTTGRLVPIEQQIALCISRRMAGRAPEAGSPDLVGLLVHLKETSAVRPRRTASSYPPSPGTSAGPVR